MIGLSSPQNSYFNGPSAIVAGQIYNFTLYSVDANGNSLNNVNDVFSISFQSNNNYYFASSYSGNGISVAYVLLGVADYYLVNVKLYNQDVAGSPFYCFVTSGYPSLQFSYIDPIYTVTAGVVNDMNVHLFDAFGNIANYTGVSMRVMFVNYSLYTSSVNASPGNQSSFGFNHSGSYSNGVLQFVVYVAGIYNVSIFIDDGLLTSYYLNVSPNSLYASNCVPVYSNYQITAGNQYSFKIQTRDYYHNNLIISLLNSYSVTASGPSSIQGSLSIFEGICTVTISPTIVGQYTINIILEDLSLGPLPKLAVTVSDLSLTLSSFTVPSSQTSGSPVSILIYTKDQYGNMRQGGDSLNCSIIGKSNTINFTITDIGSGVYSLNFTPLVVDTYIITVFYQQSTL